MPRARSQRPSDRDCRSETARCDQVDVTATATRATGPSGTQRWVAGEVARWAQPPTGRRPRRRPSRAAASPDRSAVAPRSGRARSASKSVRVDQPAQRPARGPRTRTATASRSNGHDAERHARADAARAVPIAAGRPVREPVHARCRPRRSLAGHARAPCEVTSVATIAGRHRSRRTRGPGEPVADQPRGSRCAFVGEVAGAASGVRADLAWARPSGLRRTSVPRQPRRHRLASACTERARAPTRSGHLCTRVTK